MPMPIRWIFRLLHLLPVAYAALGLLLFGGCADREKSESESVAWWDAAWAGRMLLTVDPSAGGTELADGVGPSTALVRLHGGNFDFSGARSDGADLRFLAGDDATLLPHRIERYDELLQEAFVWVRLPAIPPGEALRLRLYYGNSTPPGLAVDEGVFGEETLRAFHFAESWSSQLNPEGMPPRDAARNHTATGSGLPVESALIGGGVRLNALHSIAIPPSPDLDWDNGESASVSLWIAPESAGPNAPILRRETGASRLELGLASGVPYLEIVSENGAPTRVSSDAPLQESSWAHLAIVADADSVSLWVQGQRKGLLEGGVPRLDGAFNLPPSAGGEFAGRIDELRVLGVAWTPADVFFAYLNQGADARSQRLVSLAPDETVAPAVATPRKGNELFFVIVDTLNWDGWAIIAILFVMAVISWAVIVFKSIRLRELEHANHEFIRLWNKVGSDLGELENDERIAEAAGRLGHPVSPAVVRHSPLYHLYRTGWEQTAPRLTAGKDGAPKISALSVQAVRASMFATSTRESDRLHQNLVFLTFAISGAPFLGLLGTVLGVAVTFASIAAAGEVAVETIAPGVATTIVGLCVAIPALFGYNYLVAPIRRMSMQMRVFIDEYITRATEAYSSRKSTLSLEISAPPSVGQGNRESHRPPRRAVFPK